MYVLHSIEYNSPKTHNEFHLLQKTKSDQIICYIFGIQVPSAFEDYKHFVVTVVSCICCWLVTILKRLQYCVTVSSSCSVKHPLGAVNE